MINCVLIAGVSKAEGGGAWISPPPSSPHPILADQFKKGEQIMPITLLITPLLIFRPSDIPDYNKTENVLHKINGILSKMI